MLSAFLDCLVALLTCCYLVTMATSELDAVPDQSVENVNAESTPEDGPEIKKDTGNDGNAVVDRSPSLVEKQEQKNDGNGRV